VLVTGGAGFIGAAVSRALLRRGDEVVIADDLNDYYDPALKRERLHELDRAFHPAIHITDVARRQLFAALVDASEPDAIVHLAAMPGVRGSVADPVRYIRANILGTSSVMQAAIGAGVPRVVYASSSSVYGDGVEAPSHELDRADAPVSPYAATKRAAELVVHALCQCRPIMATGLRFFTVYGPWGRPDMAYWRFARAMTRGEAITIYGSGTSRSYTYIDDAVAATLAVLDADHPPRVVNVGGEDQVPLGRFIGLLESCLGVRAVRRQGDMPVGDVTATRADTTLLRSLGWSPQVGLDEGVSRFCAWYAQRTATGVAA
jgi:UDP-glucuronate 4-epimerase